MRFLLLLVAILGACGPFNARAMVETGTVTIPAGYAGASYASFWYKANGTVTWSIARVAPNATQSFMLLYSAAAAATVGNPCTDSEALDAAAVVFEFFGATGARTFAVEDAGLFYAYFVSCRGDSGVEASVDATTTFLNPSGQHLSADTVPLPIVYDVYCALWGAVLAAWAANWLYVRVARKLHAAITVYIVVKLASLVFLALYWLALQRAGRVSAAAAVFYGVLTILDKCGFFVVLFLVASGWGIVDNRPAHRWPVIAAAITCYALALALESFVSWYFGFLSVFVLCVVMLLVFFRCNRTFLRLLEKLHRAQQPPPPAASKKEEGERERERSGSIPRETVSFQLERQAKTLGAFRIIMMGYVLGQLVVTLLLMFLLQQWVSAFLYQLLDLAILALTAFTFRLRKEKKLGLYFLLDGDDANDIDIEDLGTQPPPQQQQQPQPSASEQQPTVSAEHSAVLQASAPPREEDDQV